MYRRLVFTESYPLLHKNTVQDTSDGFDINFLSKVADIKDTVKKQTLIHHIASMMHESHPTQGDLHKVCSNNPSNWGLLRSFPFTLLIANISTFSTFDCFDSYIVVTQHRLDFLPYHILFRLLRNSLSPEDYISYHVLYFIHVDHHVLHFIHVDYHVLFDSSQTTPNALLGSLHNSLPPEFF